MDIPQQLIPVIGFGAVAAAIYALVALFNPYWNRVSSRIEELYEGDEKFRDASDGSPTTPAVQSQWTTLLQTTFPHRATRRSQLRQRLAKAGIYQQGAVSKYYTVKAMTVILAAGAAIAVGTAAHLRFDLKVLSACLTGVFGAIVPSLWLDRAIVRQHLLLRISLPDFLDLMTVCLEGGLSLQETIRRVGEELRLVHPALATELSFVQRDIELGATVDQSLKRFATRTDYDGVRTLSTFIREAQRFGTNITEALRSHADMLRSQREQSAEENAQKAAVKILLPTMFLIFPAIFVVAVGPAVIQIHEAFVAK